MKKYLVLLSVFLFATILFSNPISLIKAEKVANNWITNSGKTVFIRETKPIIKNNITLWYLVKLQPKGFILISADDAAYPILGYSYRYNFDYPIQSPEVKAWIEQYESQLNYIITNRLDNSPTIKIWDSILNNDFSFNTSERDVSPLTQTLWNQGQYYNEQCPYDVNSTAGNNHVWAGCVATAMAQVMKFWSYPPQGTGSHSYNENDYGTLSADFGATTYNWSNMPNSPNTVIDDVTTLLFHLGVSVDMDYGTDGSGAWLSDAVNSLKTYFDYNSEAEMVWKSDYNDSSWENLLKADLDNGRPILYRGQGSGGGHAFVCDGYEGTNHFHFNWGWSGSANGYYYLNNLNPNGYDFSSYQGAGVHIHPNSETSFPPPSNLTATVNSSSVSLSWEAPTRALSSYNIYRDDNLLASTSNTYYTDASVTAGHRYSYYVTAVYTSPDGESTHSNTAIAVLPVDLPYSTDFSSTDGWWQISENCSDRWQISDTNNSGGDSPEMICHWEDDDPATTKLVSPPLKTENTDQLNLSFKHFYDYYSSSNITVKIQSSSDGVTWTDESWQHINPGSNIGPQTVNTIISNNLGDITYIAWVITGNLYNFDYWYVDDVSISVPPPVFNLSPTSLDFGDVIVNSSSTLQFTISNTGHSVLTGNITTPTDFTVSEVTQKGSLKKKKNTRNSISYSIAAGNSQDFNLVFTPSSETSYSNNVTISSNDSSNSTNFLQVTGTGIAPDINYNPSSYTTTMEPDKTKTSTLTISNSGSANLDFSVSAHLPTSRAIVNVYPQSSTDWTGTTDGSTKTQHSLVKGYDNEDGWMKFDISNIPNGAIIDSVRFHGYVNSTYWPYWSITPLSSDPVTTSASDLKNDIIEEEDSGYYLYKNENSSYSTGWKTYTLEGNIIQDLTNALNTGWFAIGISSRDNSTDYYIYFDGWNEANPPYLEVFYSIEVPWIKFNNQYSYSSTVPVGNSEDITIQFDTTDMDLGDYNANIVITSNDPDENSVSIPVSLSVQHLAIVDLSPTTLNYGDVYVGSPSTKQFNLHNDGGLTLQGYILTISGYEISSAAKSDSLEFSIASGNTQTFNLTCNPQNSGSFNGNILIHSNDINNPDVYLAVSANGLYHPIISVNKDSLTFGNVVVGEFISKTFTITNDGDEILNGSIFQPTDFYVYNSTNRDFKPSYIQRDTLGFTIYPHQSKDYIVYFYPLSSGNKTGNITFQSNDAYGNNPEIAVSGTGYFLPPSNVSISISDDNVILNWDYNNHVSIYHIYSSDKPNSGFTELGTIPQPPFTILNGTNSTRKFYRVTAE